MILLKQNTQLYNNDLRAMIMAFYPGVKIVEEASNEQKYLFSLVVDYNNDKTAVALCEPSELCDGTDYTDCALEAGKEQSIEKSHSYNEIAYNETKLIAGIYGNYENKPVFRNLLKSAAYNLLCSMTGRVLPWGDLTGVRPTKIAMAELKAGKSYEDAVSNYINTYHVSDRKANLATKVASFEMGVIADIDMNNDYCLYVGIPFCPSRCLYCSFTSYPIGVYKDKAAKYVDKLCEELEFIADAYKDKNLVSIYIGGGTPTSIDHILLDKLLTKIDKVFGLVEKRAAENKNCSVCDDVNVINADNNNCVSAKKNLLREYTVEAGRPDSITFEKLQVMRAHNVTRISINPQTMNDETLRTIGRAHTSDQTKEAFAMAREAGFDNINMDLIAGLPGENIDSMVHTLREIEALAPESITVHSLAIKRAANLKSQLGEYGDSINQDMDAMLDMVSDLAEKLGMEPYYLYRQKNIGGNLENVGYAKKGLECLYNILIMEEITDIIAAGAGASTKLTYHSENRVERVENCKSVDDYIDRFEEMLNRKRKMF